MTCTAKIAATVSDDAATTLWSYTADDPWVITVAFRLGAQTSTWLFGRELLAEALAHVTAGDGDVMWAAGTYTVILTLDTPEGICLVEFDRGPVEMFMAQTECVVPLGAEAIDWAAEMRHVLA